MVWCCPWSSLLFNIYDGNGRGIVKAQLGVKLEELCCGARMYADNIVLVADSGIEMQTTLEMVQACVMRWKMRFNSRKSKIMVVGKRKGRMIWKIGEEIMEEVEEFKYLGVWLDRKLR